MDFLKRLFLLASFMVLNGCTVFRGANVKPDQPIEMQYGLTYSNLYQCEKNEPVDGHCKLNRRQTFETLAFDKRPETKDSFSKFSTFSAITFTLVRVGVFSPLIGAFQKGADERAVYNILGLTTLGLGLVFEYVSNRYLSDTIDSHNKTLNQKTPSQSFLIPSLNLSKEAATLGFTKNF